MRKTTTIQNTSSAYQASEQLSLKGFFLILFMLLLSIASFSQPCQCGSGRYLQPIFGKIALGTNIQYTQNASTNYNGTTEQEGMDIWGAAGDNCNKRPVIIWVHGGGFSQQDRTAPDVVAMCDTFSRRGFVVASINYRDDYWGTSGPVDDNNSQNPSPYDQFEFTRAAYRAMQDAKCAVRFFKSYATYYGIDTNNIFMGGTSAGGWTSLMVAYLDKISEKPAATGAQSSVIGVYSRPDLGSIDGSGGWNNVSSRLKGILSIFGALVDTSFVDGSTDPAAYHFHEYGDQVVNFYYGAPFQGQYQNFASYWGDYYIDMQSKNVGGVSKSRWMSGSQHSLYPYRGLVTTDVSSFLDSIICTNTNTIEIYSAINSFEAKVYPNPSQGTLEIEIPTDNAEGDIKLKIYNLLGTEVHSSMLQVGLNNLDILPLDNGVYIVNILSGTKHFDRRLILNK